VDDAWLERLRAEVGELPAARRKRYTEQLALAAGDVATLTADRATGDYFEAALSAGGEPRRVANLVVNVVATLANKRGVAIAEVGIPPQRVAEVAKLIDASKIAASNALPLLEKLL
jgi:aspartyl-tRNA(Asn)/glutamyl-tRNA(Gln) amidotransferase subunit B